MKTDISIIIATKDRPQALKGCLDSLDRQSSSPLEIIIVDAGRKEKADDICKSWLLHIPATVKYLRTESGASVQRNAGIRHSKGGIIGFIDDDVILRPGCLENVQRLFLQDESLGGVGAVDEAAFQIPLVKRLFCKIFMLWQFDAGGKMQPSGYPTACNNAARSKEVDSLPSTAAFFKRAVFDEFSFDEKIPYSGGMEDTDFSFRAGRKFRLIQSPDVKIMHECSRGLRAFEPGYTYTAVYYHYYFFNKNMPKSFLNKVCFFWSQIGEFLRAVYWAVKGRKADPLRGLLRAHRRIAEHRKSGRQRP